MLLTGRFTSKNLAWIAFAAILLSGCSNSQTFDPCESIEAETIETASFNKGLIAIRYDVKEITRCFEYGDVLAVIPQGYDAFIVPLVKSYYDVPTGQMMLWANPGDDYVLLAKSMTQVTVDFSKDDEQSRRWRILDGEVEQPLKVRIKLHEKGGYKEALERLYALQRADSIKYYPDLSVEEFANFRMVSTTGFRKGILYRSSSPIDPSLGRNRYADSLSREAGITAFIDLSDKIQVAYSFEGFKKTYYYTQSAVYAGLPSTVSLQEFKDGFVNILRYIYTYDGPFLIHCREGKDRTGYAIALLEALMGAPLDEILADYIKSFTNFYNVIDGERVQLDEAELVRLKNEFVARWIDAYAEAGVDISDIENVDLAGATADYLVNIGMDRYEIGFLEDRLKAD